ncbi:hypothetical protein COW36_10180 [bacterium (Candidatus Blackallbacteria) CG17_big_fil_post_rev_8_21_14_2_50_48_46]|uniref:Sulfotransferase domain-containing protein n=1 Tax=bacterium (Candidatus Blackallbacteria) CG17_big_fil_post_rev_8_21_14_2_50_48_46 TaxID=2014261 RepID=A0A2M7G4Z7_9BACT|nr:MAG: hypothetical protein COW64_19950 [bacterium (Candidatus Blackallbacteria) CG18_big_fil_WC_8_21_14_2_50_49_26]PIW17000.1 MAG: hypothetical protein COW36_10180 [bacterium (Candidatus Blackallbacteria) CG17_big_fil_post_rev_8_21_14_2_50_48_46]PIW48192.1 MAG: hypothetical protein COW20_10495 [bacterium (Candidatus Blackallbacteria) CG13_big_fil_rev_8_21_14_2_50_49_14]
MSLKENKPDLFNPDIVFIIYWGRSGSVFLQSLLDNHPEVFSTPATTLSSYHLDWEEWGETYTGKQDEKSWNQVLDAFCNKYPHLFWSIPDPTWCNLEHLGKNQDQKIEVSKTEFQQQFKYLLRQQKQPLSISRRQVFILVHMAYELAQGHDITKKHLIIFPKHVPDMNQVMKSALEDFPNAKILGTVRDPIRGFFSHLRMHIQESRIGRYRPAQPDYDMGEAIISEQFYYLLRHLLMGWNDLPKYNPKLEIKSVQLETLHAQPEETMKELSQWLKIQWDSCLLESTFNGLQYWGDRSAYQKVQGFQIQHPLSDSWQSEFSLQDQKLLYLLLAKELKTWGYLNLIPKNNIFAFLLVLKPFKCEFSALIKCIQKKKYKKMLWTLRRIISSHKLMYLKFKDQITFL